MTKKPSASKARKGDPVPPAASAEEVLGDLVDSDFDVAITDEGAVTIRARCPEESDGGCADRMRFLVEALGDDFLPPPELLR